MCFFCSADPCSARSLGTSSALCATPATNRLSRGGSRDVAISAPIATDRLMGVPTPTDPTSPHATLKPLVCVFQEVQILLLRGGRRPPERGVPVREAAETGNDVEVLSRIRDAVEKEGAPHRISGECRLLHDRNGSPLRLQIFG